MKKIFLLPVAILASLSFFPSKVLAQSALRYPIAELGYCRDAKECFLYCEIPANKAACWSYGMYKLGPQVLAATTISTQEDAAMRAKAKELGITFPVAELGNCAGPAECKDFCEQPANQTTCANFAKNRGLDHGPSAGGDAAKEQEILAAAQSELGCTTKESCFQKCDQDHAACEAFAKRHGIAGPPSQSGGRTGADKEKLLNDAKSQLGCNSMESCSQLCQQNPKRCEEFARTHGLSGSGSTQGPSGTQGQYQQGPPGQYGQYGGRPAGGQQGPGGCDSEASCKAYCQSHPSECSGFQPSGSSTGGNYPSQGSGPYVGPSGCRTQEECAAYCKANPSTCPGFSQGQQQNGGSGSPTGPSRAPYPIPSGGTPYPQQYQPQQQYQQPSPPPGPTYPSGSYTSPAGTSYPSGGYPPHP